MYAYCLFCNTVRRGELAAAIRWMLGIEVIAPKIVQKKWIKGKATEDIHDYLPGYLFLYTEEPIAPRLNISGIIRFLGNGELANADLAFAVMLYQRNGILGTVQLFEEGDRCFLADPSWEHVQGTILKMDRGRKRCCVEFEFDHVKRSVWVGYELIRNGQST